jgi:ribosomal protein S18 acetylase RimI-like enzyme
VRESAHPQFQVQLEEHIPKQYSKRVAVLLDGCFRAAASRPNHADRFCSQGDAWRYVLATDAQSVTGFATIYRRSIEWNGETVALGGLGDVCTDPVWRHRGVASAIVRMAMAELERVGSQLAYLCAAVDNPGILHLYGQVGFVPLRRAHTYDGKSGRKYIDTDGMIAPVGSARVFEDIMHSDKPLHLGRGNW